MKCKKCNKTMKPVKKMDFNNYKIDGWKCSCGEIYYNPEQAQKILVMNKLKHEVLKAKLGRIRSNLILRIPRDLEYALGLEQGEDVFIKLEDKGFRIIPT